MEGWGFLTAHGCTHLILDRDKKSGAAFRRMLKDAGIKVLRLPPRSPSLNVFVERWVRIARRNECLSHLILFGEAGVELAIAAPGDRDARTVLTMIRPAGSPTAVFTEWRTTEKRWGECGGSCSSSGS